MKNIEDLYELSTAFESRLQELGLEILNIVKEPAKCSIASPSYPFARDDVFYIEALVRIPANKIQDAYKETHISAFCQYTENKCYFSIDAEHLPWKQQKHTESYIMITTSRPRSEPSLNSKIEEHKMIYDRFDDDKGILTACRTLAVPEKYTR